VELGCVLLGKTNLVWMAKSKVALDYKFEHTNRELDELLTCRRGAPGVLNRVRPAGLGRPAWADRPGWLRALPGSGFFQHTHFHFVTFVPACSMGCTAQILSSTPLLALLVLPLDVFALSHVHAPLLHMPP
jgi:hypothetical protein